MLILWHISDLRQKLSHVLESVKLIRTALIDEERDVPLIGFSVRLSCMFSGFFEAELGNFTLTTKLLPLNFVSRLLPGHLCFIWYATDLYHVLYLNLEILSSAHLPILS